MLAIAGVLCNGISIVQCTDWADPMLTVFQLDVGSHELMLAEGAAVETFGGVDNVRASYDNCEE